MKKNGFCKKVTEKSLKKIYEKCKPSMLERFGYIMPYDEFVRTLAYAHQNGFDK